MAICRNKSKENIMDIKCKKTSCMFNKNYTCMSKDIKVNFCQSCVSYKASENEQNRDKKGRYNRFEVGNELFDYIRCPNKKVNCDSYDCRFNNNSECNSNGITIYSEGNDTVCVSYIKK